MAYCDVTELKRYLGITGSGDDTLLGELLASAQQMIDTETNKTFEAAEDSTRYLDAIANVNGRQLIFDHPCASITSITNGDGVLVAATDYVTEPRNRKPYYAVTLKSSKNVTWTYGDDEENAIAVVGKWAYSVTAPDDVVQACKRLAAFLYRQRENASDVDRAVVVGNATVLPSQLPSDVMATINKYSSKVGWL